MKPVLRAPSLDVQGKGRLFLAIFSPLFTFLMVQLSVNVQKNMPADDFFMQIVKSIVFETFVTMAFMSFWMSIWAIAKPKWMSNLLAKQIKKVMIGSLILYAVFIIMALVVFCHW